MKGGMEELKLEVGESYINQQLEIVKITEEYLKTFRGLNTATNERHWYFHDGKIAPIENKRNADIIAKFSLKVGEYYEDEMHDVWEIKRGNYKCFMAVNSSGVGRWYNDDGTCRGHSGKDSHYPKCNLVRKVFPNRIVAGKGISTTLAEELRKTAENYNSIEGQTARLKEKAIEAAKQGAMRIEIDDSVHYNEQLKSALAKDGFTVVSEFIQTPDLVHRSGSKILSKVYLSWGNP